MKKVISAILATVIFLAVCGCSADSPDSMPSAAEESEISSAEASSAEASSRADSSAPTARKVRIMPMGDSLTQGTEGSSGYRNYLCQALLDGGYDFCFVGPMITQPDLMQSGYLEHAGWGGITIEGMMKNIDSLVRAKPDIILLMIGTNDLGEYTLTKIKDDYRELIGTLYERIPDAYIFCASPPPCRIYTGEHYVTQTNETYRKFIEDFVSEQKQAGAKIDYVNMNTESSGIDWNDYYMEGDDRETVSGISKNQKSDHVHPIASGWEKIGLNWYSAVKDKTGEIYAQFNP